VEFAEDRRWNGDWGSVMNQRQRSGKCVNSRKMMDSRQRSRKSVNNRQRCGNNRQRSRKSMDDRSNMANWNRGDVLDHLSGSRVRATVRTAAFAAQSSIACLGLSDSSKVGHFSFVNFGGVDDDSRSYLNSCDGQSFTGSGFSDSGKVGELSLSYFWSIEDGSGANENGSSTSQRSLRQEIGKDAESTFTSGVVDNDLLTVGIDVRIMTDLIAHSVAEVGSGLISSDVTETGLTEFILRVEFAEDRRWNGDRSSVMNQRQWSGKSVNSRKMMDSRQRSRKRCGQSMDDRSYMTDDRERSSYRNLMTENGC
jgi:hypothetical protein